MDNNQLAPALIRLICREPATEYREDGYDATRRRPPRSRTSGPPIVIVIPGIADSSDSKTLIPIIESLMNAMPTSIASTTLGPLSWSLDLDVVKFTEKIRRLVRHELRCHPHSPVILVAFSLGGVAALYYLAQWGYEATVDGERPKLITLASPICGSNRYQRAFDKWQEKTSEPTITAMKTIVAQLDPHSPIMTAVQGALSKYDVHTVLSRGDRIVDRGAACPPWFEQVTEIDTGEESLLKKHFGFPQHPAVIDEVIRLLHSYARLGVDERSACETVDSLLTPMKEDRQCTNQTTEMIMTASP